MSALGSSDRLLYQLCVALSFLILIVLWDKSVHQHQSFKIWGIWPSAKKHLLSTPETNLQFSPRSSAPGLARCSIHHNEQCLWVGRQWGIIPCFCCSDSYWLVHVLGDGGWVGASSQQNSLKRKNKWLPDESNFWVFEYSSWLLGTVYVNKIQPPRFLDESSENLWNFNLYIILLHFMQHTYAQKM